MSRVLGNLLSKVRDPSSMEGRVMRNLAEVALARGEEHAMRAVDVQGNARLAAEVLVLVRHLRWDLEEDLSRLFGDVVAHRLAGAARATAEAPITPPADGRRR